MEHTTIELALEANQPAAELTAFFEGLSDDAHSIIVDAEFTKE